MMALASIRKLGDVYTIDLKLIDPLKNTYLFTANERGEGQGSIPDLIDNLAEKTRLGLQETKNEIKSSQKSLPVNDLNERLKALMNLWEGTYILNDKRQYLRVGLNTLMGSPEINNYFKTLEKSRGENNEKMALEALYALSNGIQRATEGTYDKNVQEQPYIIPNIKLHQLRTRRHYDKNAPFGENLK